MQMGIDLMLKMMPEKINEWRSGKPAEGFWWRLKKGDNNQTLAHLKRGPYAKRTYHLLYRIVPLMAKLKHNVIVDEICLTPKQFQKWQRVLKPYNVVYVGLKCPTATLDVREKWRGDRMLGSAHAQNLCVHKGATYDIEVDTSKCSAQECAIKIMRFLDKRSKSSANRP